MGVFVHSFRRPTAPRDTAAEQTLESSPAEAARDHNEHSDDKGWDSEDTPGTMLPPCRVGSCIHRVKLCNGRAIIG